MLERRSFYGYNLDIKEKIEDLIITETLSWGEKNTFTKI